MAEYLSALFVHWVALMSGSISLIIGLILRIGRRFSESVKKWPDIPDWIFICVGIFCLFLAGYGAWQDKNKDLITCQKKLEAPQLSGTLNILATAIDTQGRKTVTVGGAIYNPYGPPTAIADWKMTANFIDGRNFNGQFRHPQKNDTTIPIPKSKEAIVFPASDYWPLNNTPIPAGGKLPGWISFYFNDLDFDEAYKQKASFVLEVTDVVANNKHRLTITFDKRGINVPGVTQSK